VLVVCDDQSGMAHAEVDGETINYYKLSVASSNHGISYIETGIQTWVTLFLGHKFNGMSYVIPPYSSVWLETVQLGYDPAKNWNDNIKSFKVDYHTGAVMYQVYVFVIYLNYGD
jgi:hypothetical protein